MVLAVWQREVVAALVYANVWTLFYYFCLRAPIPAGWTLRGWWWATVAAAAIGGASCRIVSRRVWAVGGAAALGIILGASQAYFTDTFISPWQQLWGGLTAVGPYPFFVWAASTTGWAAADRGVRLWRKKAP